MTRRLQLYSHVTCLKRHVHNHTLRPRHAWFHLKGIMRALLEKQRDLIAI